MSYTALWVIPVIVIWVVIPVYISWKYDITLKDSLKCLWLYITGRTTEAHLLLQEREDRTKPIRWFFWIPYIGRIFMHKRDMRMHPELWRELIISLIENTALYFIVGLVAGYWRSLPLRLSLGVISLLFLIIMPIEYKLTLWKPKLFLSDGDIDYVEYVCVFYHSYFYIVTGTLIGYLLRRVW